MVSEQNEGEANKVNNIKLKVEVPKTEIDDVSKINQRMWPENLKSKV